MQKVLNLIDPLRSHAAGAIVYQQVESNLRAWTERQQKVQGIWAALADSVLETIAAKIEDRQLRRQLELLQQCLQPPLLHSEVNALLEQLQRHAAQTQAVSERDSQLLREAFAPLLGDAEDRDRVDEDNGSAAFAIVAPTSPAETSEDRGNFPHLQSALADQLRETVRQHKKFSHLLAATAVEWGSWNNKQQLLRDVYAFLTNHRELANQLNDAYGNLQRILADTRRLNDELQRVRQLSLTDDLTGLPNRRAFDRALDSEIARVRRYGGELAVAMIDLDHFKEINDNYGHAAGDQVLAAYAKDVLSVLRRYDVVARYGGEEFAVLLPNTSLEGVRCALAKIKERIPQVSVRIEQLMLTLPVFSAGIAMFDASESAEAFIARADAALYRAKERGRNRVESAEEEPDAVQRRPEAECCK